MYIHINYTRYSRFNLRRQHCPNCSKRTFFASFFQEWYGWDQTCLKCGDKWQDGEMCERPFMRGWRKERIKQAKRAYRTMPNPPSEGKRG